MKYDTLILSGGSLKGYAFIGSFKYLLDLSSEGSVAQDAKREIEKKNNNNFI